MRSAHRSIVGLYVITLGVVAATACDDTDGRATSPASVGPAISGVVLVVNDTMRRDRLGAYGGSARTPRFDAFASAHLRFESAYSAAPWTKPSMASLFTGLYPSQHRVLSHPQPDAPAGAPRFDALGDDFVTLAEALAGGGFETAAFVGNPWMGRQFGFAQGFEHYDDSFAAWDAPGSAISEAALGWMRGRTPGTRFFLFLHYMDSHRPYGRLDSDDLGREDLVMSSGAEPLDPAEAAEIARHLRLGDGRTLAEADRTGSVGLLERAYDRGLENFDRALGVLLDGLEDGAAWATTAVVVTSDHGEALYTRGYGNHGNGLYEDEIAVPLAARLPGVSADSLPLTEPVGLVDLMPTLCRLLELDCPADLYGRVWPDEPATDVVVVEGVTGRPRNRAVRRGDYKLIWQPKRGPAGAGHRLFKVSDDPLETNDLLAGDRPTAASQTLANELLQAGADAVPPIRIPESERRDVDEATLERLRSLGYID